MLLSVTLPVRNGARLLEAAGPVVWNWLQAHWPGESELVIAENGSDDSTREVAAELGRQYSAVRCLTLPCPGRGGALRKAWNSTPASIVGYMDVDLSTSLSDVPAMVKSIQSGECDLVAASRYLRPETTERSLRREVLSRGHNWLARRLTGLRVTDAQCGCKFLRREVRDMVLHQIRDDGWFFDTELLLAAQRSGFRIDEYPVHWTEAATSQVRTVPTVIGMLAGIWRVRAQG